MEYEVTKLLPRDGEMVMCFRHKTYCCSEDMDEEPNWHKVIFRIGCIEYKLKDKVPKNPEKSIFEFCHFMEFWDCVEANYHGYGTKNHIIGVKKWKRIEKELK